MCNARSWTWNQGGGICVSGEVGSAKGAGLRCSLLALAWLASWWFQERDKHLGVDAWVAISWQGQVGPSAVLTRAWLLTTGQQIPEQGAKAHASALPLHSASLQQLHLICWALSSTHRWVAANWLVAMPISHSHVVAITCDLWAQLVAQWKQKESLNKTFVYSLWLATSSIIAFSFGLFPLSLADLIE